MINSFDVISMVHLLYVSLGYEHNELPTQLKNPSSYHSKISNIWNLKMSSWQPL